MKAIAKAQPGPGVQLIDVPEPEVTPGSVKIRLQAASVCGTDLHIYNWDPVMAARMQLPRIIGHEFCGDVVEVGPGVTERHIGQFVSSESHITCGVCRQCRMGQRHVCVNTRILGIDVDGGFAEYAVIPAENARPTDPAIPPEIAAFQDALGNGVHTALAGPVEDQAILITGLGPIGLFAAEVCRAMGARRIVGTEVSPYRMELAHAIGLETVLNPLTQDLRAELTVLEPEGFDAVLEMSGHPSSIELAVRHVRPGGRISLLGLYADPSPHVPLNDLIFKGVEVQGIVGRRLWETWDQMQELLTRGALNLRPIVSHVMHFTDFSEAMELMKAGRAGKVVFRFDA